MILRRKLSDEILLRIENFQPNRARRGWEGIIKHRATRRILCRWLFGRKRRAGEPVVVHTNRGGGAEKPRAARSSRLNRLAQRRDVIENPKGTPVRGNHQVVAVDGKIANRADGQVQLQGLPVVAVVPRYVNSKFGSREEEPSALRVFANGAQKCRSRNAGRDRLPSSPVVPRAIEVRRLIVEPAAIDGGIRDSGIEMRSFNQRDLAPVAQSWRGNIVPVLSSIAREVNQSRIASHPDQIAIERRGRDREHHTIAGPFGFLDRWRTLGWRTRRFRSFCITRITGRPGEIGADGLPVQTAIDRPHHILRPQIKRCKVSRGKYQRRSPGRAIFALMDLRVPPNCGPRSDVLAEASPFVEPGNGTESPT